MKKTALCRCITVRVLLRVSQTESAKIDASAPATAHRSLFQQIPHQRHEHQKQDASQKIGHTFLTKNTVYLTEEMPPVPPAEEMSSAHALIQACRWTVRLIRR